MGRGEPVGEIGTGVDVWGGGFDAVHIVAQRDAMPMHRGGVIEAVGEAAAAVSEFMNRLGVAEDVAFGVDMAVREAVTNAVVHGNKFDNAKKVGLKLRNTPEVFEISVHDQGSGFNPNEVPDPTKDENILKTSGRGIFFMRNFMDEVDWSAGPTGGTTVRMVKKL